MANQLQRATVTAYLDYVNNFLSVSAFADHYGIDVATAEQVIKTGKELFPLIGDGLPRSANPETLYQMYIRNSAGVYISLDFVPMNHADCMTVKSKYNPEQQSRITVRPVEVTGNGHKSEKSRC